MDVFLCTICGTVVLLGISILIFCKIVEGIKRKHDLEMYIVEYRKVKEERDKLKVKIDTINRIYKNYETRILDYTNEILEELIARLPRIARKYIVSRTRQEIYFRFNIHDRSKILSRRFTRFRI